ncbi:MAG: hypothetical protein AAF657_22000 [Acidobacteriota bacterium]
MHFEQILLASCSLVWLLVILATFGVIPLAGSLDLDLYRFYSFAAVLGWVTGNVYVFRSREQAKGPARRRLLLNYLMGPLSFVYFLRTLAPTSVQQAAPLVPIYGFVVYSLFFLVPVTLRASRKQRRDFGDS